MAIVIVSTWLVMLLLRLIIAEKTSLYWKSAGYKHLGSQDGIKCSIRGVDHMAIRKGLILYVRQSLFLFGSLSFHSVFFHLASIAGGLPRDHSLEKANTI